MNLSRPTPAGRSQTVDGWSTGALVSFALILIALLAAGLSERFRRPPPLLGLPEDPGVAAATRLVAGFTPAAGGLRFESSWTADTTGPLAAPERWTAAATHLDQARARLPADPRIEALTGHVDFARQRFARAEQHYRRALAQAPHYAEARLGLGCALALRARTEGGLRLRRARTLQAIAQFAAVEPGHPHYPAALYNRVLLLADAGRTSEARRWADAYRAHDSGGPWIAALERAVARPGESR